MMDAKVEWDRPSGCWNEGEGWINDVRYKIQSQRGRDSNHKATAEFVDVTFTAAYQGSALMHHRNKSFV